MHRLVTWYRRPCVYSSNGADQTVPAHEAFWGKREAEPFYAGISYHAVLRGTV